MPQREINRVKACVRELELWEEKEEEEEEEEEEERN